MYRDKRRWDIACRGEVPRQEHPELGVVVNVVVNRDTDLTVYRRVRF